MRMRCESEDDAHLHQLAAEQLYASRAVPSDCRSAEAVIAWPRKDGMETAFRHVAVESAARGEIAHGLTQLISPNLEGD
jgi:hypothetical protein